MIETHRGTLRVVAVLILLAATFFLYLPSLDHQFVFYDDGQYVYNNPKVTDGLTADGLVWAFTEEHVANWHPVTWLSHMLDVEFFGLNPKGHHLTNILFHCLNSALLLWLLYILTGAMWRSVIVAALFSLHPLHVESVAWVAERKDVLSTFWGLLTILAYSWNTRNPTTLRYLLVMFLFAMGLMSKPMLVSLPILLLLIDYWPLHRFDGLIDAGHSARQTMWLLVREKLPLFVLASLSSIVTMAAQQEGGATQSVVDYGLSARLTNAVVAYIAYLGKTAWPVDLAVIYPHSGQVLPAWQVAGAVIVLVISVFFVWKQAAKRPYLVTGWGWYLITLLPVLGIIQVGYQRIADRYTYLPLIGIFWALVWGGTELSQSFKPGKKIFSGLVGLVLLILFFLSRQQLTHWQNSTTLFERALAVTENNFVAHNQLGVMNLQQEKLLAAEQHFRETIRIRPSHYGAWNNLGLIYLRKNEYRRAEEALKEALAIRPTLATARYNLGLGYLFQRKLEKAEEEFRRAVELKPKMARGQNDLGSVLVQLGKPAEAIPHLQKAIELDPNVARAYFDLGEAYRRLGEQDRAREQYLTALQKDPKFKPAQKALADRPD